MDLLSRALIVLAAAALAAGCGAAPTRYGKGNDHEIVHPEEETDDDRAEETE